jgi:hypothetical protein
VANIRKLVAPAPAGKHARLTASLRAEKEARLAKLGHVEVEPAAAIVVAPKTLPVLDDDIAQADRRLRAALLEASAAVDHARRLREQKIADARRASALVVDGEEGARGLVRSARTAGRERVMAVGERSGPVRRLNCGEVVRARGGWEG